MRRARAIENRSDAPKLRELPALAKNTAVVVPAYNEGRVIGETLARILAIFPNVICVDDGSSDDTGDKARAAGATVLRHCTNVGQGGAIETGVEYAYHRGCRYFVTMDGDGQHRVEDARAMLDHLVKNKFDIVMGSRFLKRGTKLNASKWVVLKLGAWITRRLHGVAVTDTHNGLRVFTRDVARELHFEQVDMAHASEIYDILKRRRFRYGEFPVTVDYTAYSMAKGQSIVNAVNILIDFLLNRGGR